MDAATERTHNPRERIEYFIAEEFRSLLFLNLAKDETLHVRPVVLDQKLGQLLLDLIKTAIFSVLDLFTHGCTILIDNDQHFFRFSHLQAHHLHHLPEDIPVALFEGYLHRCVSHPSKRPLSCSLLLKICSNIVMEEVNSDLEHLVLVDFHHHQQVLEPKATDIHSFFIASHCLLNPHMLVPEKLRVKVSYSTGQHLKNTMMSATHT